MSEITNHNIWFDFVIPLLIGIIGVTCLAWAYILFGHLWRNHVGQG